MKSNKKKWYSANEIKMVHELPKELKDYDRIMKEKPNFDKSEEGGKRGDVVDEKNQDSIKSNKRCKKNL